MRLRKRPAPERDRAEGARVVAPLGDLQVGVAAGGEQARRRVVEDPSEVEVGAAERRRRLQVTQLNQLRHLAELVEGDEAVDLRDLPCSSAPYRFTMQPATRSRRTPPDPLRAATSRMVSIDSCLASSMKAQVLTITVSASSSERTISCPCEANSPSMISLSTRFLAQPRQIMPTRARGATSDIGAKFIKGVGRPRWICRLVTLRSGLPRRSSGIALLRCAGSGDSPIDASSRRPFPATFLEASA